jgi:hypothetical protein
MNNQDKNYATYKVKCRKCGKIEEMFFGQYEGVDKALRFWANEHAAYPIHKQCNCDNGSMMIHDLVSYKLML